MAIDIGTWLSSGGGEPAAQEATRAALAWRRIQDKPTEVVFIRPPGGRNEFVDPQTVRIESDSTASSTVAPSGKNAKRRFVVFGIRNHATLTDTDMEEGYRFVYEDEELRCESVIVTLGEVQGLFEAI